MLGLLEKSHVWTPIRILKPVPTSAAGTVTIAIEPGDCLILCSDGVPDAQNERDDEFGESRLTAIVQDARRQSSTEIVARVFDAIDQFAGAAPQFDDITLMVLRRLD